MGEFHTVYWENSDTSVTPISVSPGGGYHHWQASVVTVGSGLGGLLPYWERAVDRITWFWRLFRRTVRLGPVDRQVILRAVDALEHPSYPLARQAVRKTARTLGFNRPESWKELGRELKASQGRAENAFRHLEACRLVRENSISSTVSNPMCNLVVELAYHEFTIRP